MCACKLKQGGCGSWRSELGLVNHDTLHSSPSGNDKRAISGTHLQFLLLRGLSKTALGLQENPAVSFVWSVPRGEMFGCFYFFTANPTEWSMQTRKSPFSLPDCANHSASLVRTCFSSEHMLSLAILSPKMRIFCFLWIHEYKFTQELLCNS